MFKTTCSALAMVAVAVPAWLTGADPHPAMPPLTYQAGPAPSGPAYEGAWLLADDPRGDGRRVAVFGDLAGARHVAVVVPGATQTLSTFTAPDGPLAAARALFAAVLDVDPNAPVAVLAWLGYDTPEGIDPQVMRSDRARTGARELARLADVLPDGADVTWLCHSYGSVVCGLAAPTLRPDDLVLLASPGVHADHAARLGAGQVWAARAPMDPIALVPGVRLGDLGHGADPVSPGFGAHVLDVGEAQGHSEYFSPDGSLVTDLARIVLGDDAGGAADQNSTEVQL